MAFATRGNVRIHYETFGADDAPAVLLLAGTGRQSIDFDAAFCGALTGAGYRAIRFDTRDTGLSSNMAGTLANLDAVYRAARAGDRADVAYGLSDLAADAFAVLDATRADHAHLVGRSLGSSVAQVMALEAPERILSIALIMANSRSVAYDLPEAMVARVAAEEIDGEDDFIARQLRTAWASAMPQDFDAARVSDEARLLWRRGVHQGATARHFAAALGMNDLRARLSRVTVPVIVLHGTDDRTIPPAYARETAGAFPGARLEMIEGMSHDGAPRVRALWLPHIIANLARAR